MTVPLRVAIVNCHRDANKGSTALAAGLITRLRRTGRVGHVDVVSLHAGPIAPHDFRHLQRLADDITLHPSPLPDDSRTTRGAKPLWTGSVVARTVGARAEARLANRGARQSALQALARSDLVLERGGPFLKGGRLPPNPSLLRYVWPLRFARACGVPYGLVGESVGPLANPWACRVVRQLCEGASLVAVRDELGRAALVAAGVPDGRVTTMLDNGFWTEPWRSPAVERLIADHGLAGRRVLAITCRDHVDPRVEDHYLTELAHVIDELVPETFDVAVVVPNTYNPAGPSKDDRAMTPRLLARVNRRDLVRTIDADLGPDELAALYCETSLVLGRRLHSLVLGLVGGTRVLGLASDSPKTTGVLRLVGLGDYVRPVRAVRAGDLAALARRALHDQHDVQGRIRSLRRSSDASFDAFVERVHRSTARDAGCA